MTIFENAYQALNSLNENELEELAKLKAIQLMNETTVLLIRLVANIDPEDFPICQENLKLLCQAISEKSCNFFGLEISLKGENLEKLIDFMAAEFYKSRGESEDLMLLDKKVCILCAKNIEKNVALLAQTERFAPGAEGIIFHNLKEMMEDYDVLSVLSKIETR
jgi:hypothetical protein